ncbi:MAG: transporter [Saprospiraceae bacterium]|nr:transporter [Saprospiraceae bacterium]
MLKPLGLSVLLLLLAIGTSLAQTCCSGGVPISSNLGLPFGEGQTLQFNLNYDLNNLNTQKTGVNVDGDRTRERITHSTLLQLGYSINRKWAVDVLFSYVRQERRIFRQNQVADFTFTEGFGDLVFLLKYKVFSIQEDATSLSIGIGTKLETGASNRRFNGIRLNADLQPGSGATDGILWAQFSHQFAFRPSLGFSANTIYSYKGTNDNYLPITVNNEIISQSYQFGEEWQLIFNISDRLILGRNLIDPYLTLRYRTVQQDTNNDNLVPGTGGDWVFIKPGFNYWFNSSLSVGANIELPLYAFVIDTQVTPTYRFNTGIYYTFSLKKRELSILNTN